MMVYEKDGIVYADTPTEAITVARVRATEDYKLWLLFSTGERKVFDASSLVSQDSVFRRLRDGDLFLRAYVDYGTVVWDKELDIAPEFLYDHEEMTDDKNEQ